MNVTKETKAIAQGVLNYIEAFPERHDQGSWVKSPARDERGYQVVTHETLCDTTMCIAGTAIFLTKGIEEFNDYYSSGARWHRDGAEVLGLLLHEAMALFNEYDEVVALDALRHIAGGDVNGFYDTLGL